MITRARTIVAAAAALVHSAATLAQPAAVPPPPPSTEPAPNTLTPAEAAAGWKLLFDGETTRGFRGYKKQAFPEKGWGVDDASIHSMKGGGGGDLVTVDEYGDFELSLRYKCAPAANSGIIFRVAETADTTWQTGPEFQVLDDAGAKAAADHHHSAGALYELAAPSAAKKANPAGEWNHARVRIKDGVLQHFLNGAKVVECRIDDQSWKDRIAGSKFKAFEGFGVQPRGRIALQDHGDEVWFRDIKVRDLSAPMPGEITLFDGQDLSKWTAHLEGEGAGGKLEDAWSIKDGVLVCDGSPTGYLRTGADHTSYILRLDWRFSPETKKAGNSGVLLRVQGPDKVWPACVEAQLMSGAAGDFWNLGDVKMTTDSTRQSGRNTRRTHTAERPVGEWNDYEIIVDGPTITLRVNGEELNRASNVEVRPGKVALQSEGAEIHFRNVRLAPIE